MTSNHIQGPQGCAREDLDGVLELMNSILRAGSEQNLATDYPLVYRQENLDHHRIMKAGRHVVADVPFIVWPVEHEGCRFRVGIISATGTHPDFRDRGLGLKCLRNCLQCMDRQGIELSVLWTMVPTFRFYNRGGYQAVQDQGCVFRLTRNQARWFKDHGESIVTHDAANPRHLNAIQRLRGAEPEGMTRDDDRAAVLHALPKLTTHVALRRDEPVAYLVHSTAPNKPGVVEAAGDEAALETIVHRILVGAQSEAAIRVFRPLSDSSLLRLLDRVCHSEREPCFEGTMFRINDASGFFRAILPWLRTRHGGRSESFSFTVSESNETVSIDFAKGDAILGDQQRDPHFEMSRLNLTSAVFGPHPCRPYDVPEPFSSLFPFHFPISILDRS
ncbi:MAG: hypothetical protein CMJ18_03790 [Phycisphaeraceae bacterium]|nr:hypothetical protein [Phycisphaeraceae bacterium]